ncbi:hypothetical protein LEP1GSC038_3732 [Leptospira weilii str. 2006001855]|uniref:Uncharacterized protein n=2 Tax=Leptospira weilii TaxID=28184 RepID=M6Q493_9LEPT|nr:hypothetical protein [Leptospira weilii]EMM72059.1 hypothetical protein LEP1GSC038_3732 [Leptospira weilii str. 2006001855]EMN90119.1 hypothetical protein LEP1GSC108_4745 [Leptospira weilii str. UI 13098]OMI18748.1 hypothetical protein BUQ74_03315 [Leptospira weilii serovar Heyan]
MILKNKQPVLQKYNGSQTLSQTGNSRLSRGIFQHSNFQKRIFTYPRISYIYSLAIVGILSMSLF